MPLIAFLAATFAFMPKALLGMGVFGPFDILELASPWRDYLLSPPHVANAYQNDLIQALPVVQAAMSGLRHGHWMMWSPYVAGGEPVGAVPLSGVQDPFNLLLAVLPQSWALGFIAALRLLCSQLFFYLFLRRCRCSVPTATFGGLAYSFCATNLVLLGRINAYLLLPALLWAIVRLLELRRGRDIAVLGVIGAVIWLQGFPAGYANTVAIALLAATLLAPGLSSADPSASSTPSLGASLGARARRAAWRWPIPLASGLVLSVALVGFSVLPFDHLVNDSGLLMHRHYHSSAHLPSAALLSLFSLRALGGLTAGTYGVEYTATIGLVVAGLALVPILLATAGRLELPRIQRSLFLLGLVAAVGGALLVYFDTPLLALFYAAPLIGASPVGRLRIIVDLGVVVLACVGIESLALSIGGARASRPHADRTLRIAAGLALIGAMAMIALALRDYWPWFTSPPAHLARVGGAVDAGVALAFCIIAYLLHRRGPAALTASEWTALCLSALAALATFATVALQARNFTPTVPRSLLYPRTPGHRELSKLADERYRILGSGLGTYYSNTSIRFRYLDLRGLSLSTPAFRRLVAAAIPTAYQLDPFKVILDPTLANRVDWRSPQLDDLAIRYYVAGTSEVPLANNFSPATAVATRRLGVSSPMTRTVRARPRLTGFAIPVRRASACDGARLLISVRGHGTLLAQSARPALDAPTMGAGQLAFPLPAGIAHARAPVAVAIGVTRPSCKVAVGVDPSGKMSVSQLTTPAAGPPVVAVNESIFYSRATAHQIAWLTTRWAPASSASQALALATSPNRVPNSPIPASGAGYPPPDSHPSPAAVDSVSYTSDGFDVKLRAGASELLATGFAGNPSEWTVAVDGRRGRLASIDGALLGARVSPGVHRVSFRFHAPGLRLGLLLSGLGVIVAVGLLVGSRRRATRQ